MAAKTLAFAIRDSFEVARALGIPIHRSKICGGGGNTSRWTRPWVIHAGQFGPVRVGVDVLFALAGWLLGGVVGLGTVVCACLVGPCAQVFLPISGRLMPQ